eukprot:TRINITY_DN9759_c0_g1_i4.p1 TRINITY_DN9759_c0_g1~~TRINITY_DN9759_c0_g1_i4.p1  ORF type:complete len:107 (-),score=5.70 TRINITY_DN9759_c0_g1_i4:447-767(-)
MCFTRSQLKYRHSAKIHSLDPNNMTPLHYVARSGHKESLILLLKYNAPVWFFFFLPLRFLLTCDEIDQPDSNLWTPLHHASHHGNAEIVKLLCERNPRCCKTKKRE